MSQPNSPGTGTPVMDAPGPGREPEQTEDARALAFCRADGPEIFHSVSHRHEIWRQDPYDVETIHEGVRTIFQRLLNRATTPPGLPSGRMLLLQGESGSGKTHLIRAFRNYVHRQRLGYCGYMQMTTLTNNYGRYVLSNLIDSLDQPYFEADGDTSGLMRLANAVAETPHSILPTELTTLREGDFDDRRLASFIQELADLIVVEEKFAHIDLDLIRALLYLQRNEPRIKGRVLSYLRCEDLADHDRQVLGGLVPRKNEEDPQKVVELMGQLMWQIQGVSLVLCIDQLEDIYNLDKAEVRFRRAMATVSGIADHVPSSILVISCLEDYYKKLVGSLARPLVDRLERDPEPFRLQSQRSEDEIQELLKQRLLRLYEFFEVPFREEEPTFPFSHSELQKLTNLRTRDILDWCRQYQNRCINAGRLVDWPQPDKANKADGPNETMPISLEEAWNDFQAAWQVPPFEGDTELAALLSWAIRTCSEEIATGHSFDPNVHGRHDRCRTSCGKQRRSVGGWRLQQGRYGRRPGTADYGGRGPRRRTFARPCSLHRLPVQSANSDCPANRPARHPWRAPGRGGGLGLAHHAGLPGFSPAAHSRYGIQEMASRRQTADPAQIPPRGSRTRSPETSPYTNRRNRAQTNLFSGEKPGGQEPRRARRSRTGANDGQRHRSHRGRGHVSPSPGAGQPTPRGIHPPCRLPRRYGKREDDGRP